MFESNYLAEERGKSVKGIILQVIFIMIPLSGLLIFLAYIANKDSSTAKMLVIFMVVPYSLAVAIFLIFALKLMIKRWNRTIKKLNIESGNLSVETFSIFWYMQKNYIAKTSNVILKERTFPWYGKERKEGVAIKIDNEELYFIKDYFGDYDKILNDISR